MAKGKGHRVRPHVAQDRLLTRARRHALPRGERASRAPGRAGKNAKEPRLPAPPVTAGSAPPSSLSTPADSAAPLRWDESWNPETARLAYEHARETYRFVDAATDVLDRKVVAVFTVASAIAALAPVLGKFRLWSDRWWLSVGAAVMWALAAVECWRAFNPRVYRLDPNVGTIATPGWLALSPGAFYVERLKSVRESIKQNIDAVGARAAALRGALKCALVEVGFLLAALLWH